MALVTTDINVAYESTAQEILEEIKKQNKGKELHIVGPASTGTGTLVNITGSGELVWFIATLASSFSEACYYKIEVDGEVIFWHQGICTATVNTTNYKLTGLIYPLSINLSSTDSDSLVVSYPTKNGCISIRLGSVVETDFSPTIITKTVSSATGDARKKTLLTPLRFEKSLKITYSSSRFAADMSVGYTLDE